MTTTTEQTITLFDAVLDAIMEAGFLPADVVHDDSEYSDLDWIEPKGWDAFLPITPAVRYGERIPSHRRHVALVRWGEDGIDLTVSTRNYVIESEAHFDMTPFGVRLFAGSLRGLR